MTQQRTLWDHLLDSRTREEEREREDRQRSRKETIKRLRASGHWLTLLRVAKTIPQPFTLNDVSIAVWKADPEFFGMKGYPYPDNHKVHYILYGTRGLIARGFIKRVRQGLFRVPEGVDEESLFRAAAEGEAEEAAESAPECEDAACE